MGCGCRRGGREKWRVAASGSGDRVDPLMRSIFDVGRKTRRKISKGKGLFGPNGGRCGKVEVRFDNFRGGGEEVENCAGNGGRGSFTFRRDGGSLAICSMESKDGLGGGGLVVVGGSSSSVSKRAWGEVGGVENKSLMGSMLMDKGEECLDGWVGAGGGEVKGGGVDFGVTKSLLGEIPGENLELMEGPFDSRWVVIGDYKEGIPNVGELTLFSLDVSQVFNFFLQIGLTLIFATLEDLDLGLLGDVISEDDCGDDGEDENVFIIGERCNLGWMNIVKITSPRDV
ncbi:hypothetical protein Tco_1188081 [Tanacetum coccineum]